MNALHGKTSLLSKETGFCMMRSLRQPVPDSRRYRTCRPRWRRYGCHTPWSCRRRPNTTWCACAALNHGLSTNHSCSCDRRTHTRCSRRVNSLQCACVDSQNPLPSCRSSVYAPTPSCSAYRYCGDTSRVTAQRRNPITID